MIVMNTGATQEEIEQVVQEIEQCGLRADVSKGACQAVIGPIGDERRLSFAHLASLPGVEDATMVDTPYKLISRGYSRLFGETGEKIIEAVIAACRGIHKLVGAKRNND